MIVINKGASRLQCLTATLPHYSIAFTFFATKIPYCIDYIVFIKVADSFISTTFGYTDLLVEKI